MTTQLELLLERSEEKGARILLRSPEVGTFTHALPKGALLYPGAEAGVLESLGRALALVAPSGVSGRIASDRPKRVHEPVGYGTVLYELEPLEADAGADPGPDGAPSAKDARGSRTRGASGSKPSSRATGAKTDTEGSGLVFRAPYSGRFWHRPSPQDPPFVKPGDVIHVGTTLGLVEVMKTFTHLVYVPGASLPQRAKIVRVLVADGGEVSEGAPLVELGPP